MLVAVLADIHANRQAFEACLAHARQRGAEQFALLGDYVGYGADPERVTRTVMDLVAGGAVAVRGNHDTAVGSPRERLNAEAQVAIEWTRSQLSLEQQRFLAGLPLVIEQDGRLLVHADASAPQAWGYVTGTDTAIRCLRGTGARLTFCGHIHRPAVYSLSTTGKIVAFTPTPGAPVPLLPHRRWLVVLGAVGQPRDGDAAACYVMLDTAKDEVTFHRVAYDIDAAADAIRRNGLPEHLAARLYKGR